MAIKAWAETDEDWKRKEERALAQRAANAEVVRAGQPMPYPNPWDLLDPTKVPRDATAEQIRQSHREFNKICPPFRPKRHTI